MVGTANASEFHDVILKILSFLLLSSVGKGCAPRWPVGGVFTGAVQQPGTWRTEAGLQVLQKRVCTFASILPPGCQSIEGSDGCWQAVRTDGTVLQQVTSSRGQSRAQAWGDAEIGVTSYAAAVMGRGSRCMCGGGRTAQGREGHCLVPPRKWSVTVSHPLHRAPQGAFITPPWCPSKLRPL